MPTGLYEFLVALAGAVVPVLLHYFGVTTLPQQGPPSPPTPPTPPAPVVLPMSPVSPSANGVVPK